MQLKKAKEKTTVTTTQKISMGFGDLGYGMVNNTMSSFIMYFGTTVMGVSGTLMGLAVASGTMWDAVTDPMIGHASDNARSKYFGRRHQFILIGIIFMALANIMLWSVPADFSMVAKFFWFTIGIIALETCHTLFATPNAALSIEISKNYNERSNIQSVKSVFSILGILMPTLLMGMFQKSTAEYADGRFNPQSYLNFAYLTSACIILFGTVMFIVTYSHVPRLREIAELERSKQPANKPKGFKVIMGSFFRALKDKNFSSVIVGYSIAMMASTILVAYGFNAFTFTFKTSATEMYIIMAGLFIMTIAGQPLWLYISKKYNKKTATIAGLGIALIGCGMLFAMFLARDFFNGLLEVSAFGVVAMMPPLIVAGLGIGVMFSMPFALIGDAIVVEKAETGQDKTATYTGFMTLANKASAAISSLILGILLDAMGFVEGSTVQSESVESGLGWMLCIGVTLAVAGGMIAFSRYNVSRADVQKALDKLSSYETTDDATK
ncbi:MAG: MFS transporter [Bacillota bacterium]